MQPNAGEKVGLVLATYGLFILTWTTALIIVALRRFSRRIRELKALD